MQILTKTGTRNINFIPREAISGAKNEDVILVAGKGREMFQEVRLDKIPYQDLNSIRAALEAREHV